MIATWMALPGAAPAQTANPMATVHVVDFPYCCPRPDWWDEVGEVPRIDDMDGFNTVWRSDALSRKQKAKVLFQVIEDHRHSDDNLTAAAVTYFFSVGRDYAHRRELTEFGLARYIDYDRPLEGYAGKPGDLTAGMARNLSGLYIADGEPELALPILRYILGPRRAEVNDHLLEFAAWNLGRALGALGRDPEAIRVLLKARCAFEGDWEEKLDDELAAIRKRMGPAYYLHDRRASGPAFVAVLGLVLALGVFWRRKPRRV